MHEFLVSKKLVVCKKCAKPVRPHTMCENCGTYRDKTVVDVMAKLTKKEKKVKAEELESKK